MENGFWNKLFISVIVFMLFSARIFIGCEASFCEKLINSYILFQLDFKILKSALKNPAAPIIGFCCQFGIMPAVHSIKCSESNLRFKLAYVFSKFILSDEKPFIVFGLFAMGCVPGGDASNFWTYLLGANVNLSVFMTFLGTIASLREFLKLSKKEEKENCVLVMTTLWMRFASYSLLNTKDENRPDLQVPYLDLFVSLGGLTIPLLIGCLIVRYRPTWAEIIRKV